MDSLRGPVVEAAGISTAITRKSYACSSFSLPYACSRCHAFLGRNVHRRTPHRPHRRDRSPPNIPRYLPMVDSPIRTRNHCRVPKSFCRRNNHENALLHWREGNHPSIKKYMVEVMNVMSKEHRNRFNMPLPNYIYRYIPHCFLTPQHALQKPGKMM